MPIENLTEEQVRMLLARAGASIEVEEAVPAALADLSEPGARRWQTVAVAVAVAAVIVGGFVLLRQIAAEEEVVPQPIEQPYRYDDDQVPAVLGYTVSEAVELLESKGLDVDVRRRPACGSPGYVGAVGEQGDRIEPGQTVYVETFPVCGRGSEPQWRGVWELVRFARGLGPAPDLSDEVRLAIGEGDWTTLSRDEAGDPDSWTLCADGECHSALGAIAQGATLHDGLYGGRASDFQDVSPFLDVDRAPVNVSKCPITPDPEPNQEISDDTSYLSFDFPSPPPNSCPGDLPGLATGPVLRIDRDDDGRIAAVRLQLPLPVSLEEARVWDEELDTERQRAVDAFVAWARREGPPPPFADEVELFLLGDEPFGSPLVLGDPTDRSAYALCSGLPPGRCRLDPVAVIEQHTGDTMIWGESVTTEVGGGGAPQRIRVRGDELVVVLAPRGVLGGTRVIHIQVWVDPDGRIYALNLDPPG